MIYAPFARGALSVSLVIMFFNNWFLFCNLSLPQLIMLLNSYTMLTQIIFIVLNASRGISCVHSPFISNYRTPCFIKVLRGVNLILYWTLLLKNKCKIGSQVKKTHKCVCGKIVGLSPLGWLLVLQPSISKNIFQNEY